MPGGWIGWSLLTVLVILGTLYFLIKRFVKFTIIRTADAALGHLLSQLDRPAFEQGVRDYCASIGKPIVINHDFSAQFENATDREEFRDISLHNLALGCAKYEASVYPKLIASHFQILTNKDAMMDGAMQLTEGYETAREAIAVRLYNQAYVDSQQGNMEQMHFRKLAENLYAVIVIDLPAMIIPLTRDQTESWGKSDEEIFEQAVENTRKLVTTEPRLDDLLHDKVFSILDSDEHYIASTLLWIESHPQAIGPYGAVIAVPARGVFLTLPITKITIMDSLPPFLQAHIDIFNDTPGTISMLPYWYYKGELEVFRLIEGEDGQAQLLSGEKLSAMILEVAKAHASA